MKIDTREEIKFVKQYKDYDGDGNEILVTQVHRQTFKIDPSITVVAPVDEKRDNDNKIVQARVRGISDKKGKIDHDNKFFGPNDSLPQDVIDWQNNA